VTIIARRGPLEIKFDEKEIGYLERHISRDEMIAELARVRERCERCNQDVSPANVFENHFRRLKDPDAVAVPPQLSFRFLSSPTAILAGPDGRIAQVEVTENDLVLKDNGDTAAVKTKATATLDIDTLIFAIGDRHDTKIGLPMGPEGYATRPDPEHPTDAHFEVWNPETGSTLSGIYVVGWARRASTGLVGIARHDGELGAAKAIEYLKNLPDSGSLSEADILTRLEKKGLRPVTKADLDLLAAVEKRIAEERQLTSFKYSDDEAMYKAIHEEKTQLSARHGAEIQSVPSS
jgi:ferredoxin/flavodoxin---NADP+ reductase